MTNWTPQWGTSDLKYMLTATIPYGATKTQRRSIPQGTSTMERQLRDQLHRAATQEGTAKVRQQIWGERRTQTEQARHRMAHVLANLTHGGWGRKISQQSGQA